MDSQQGRAERIWRRFDAHRFATAWIAFGTIFFALYLHEYKPGDRIDLLITTSIALSYGLSVLVMLIGTAAWSMRSMGLFFTAIGNSTLYGYIAYVRVSGNTPNEGWLDIARAAYLVGAPMVLVGLGIWVVVVWFPGPITRRIAKNDQGRYGRDISPLSEGTDDEVHSVYNRDNVA
jgi:hypothetical protein